MKTTRSSFLKVRCEKCKNEQIVFSNSSSLVYCLVCGDTVLVQPQGGHAKILGSILKELR